MSTFTHPPVRLICVALLGAGLLASCGQGVQPVTFDSTLPTDTTSPTATSPTAAPTSVVPTSQPEGQWVDATGNLAGLKSECGTLTLVASAPDTDFVLAGVAKQGLWQSGKQTTSWLPIGRAAGSAVIDNRPSAVVFDPRTSNAFWESGIYGSGVFKTTDGGKSFAKLGNITHVDLVSVDFTDPLRRTLVAGLHEQPKVMRSSDGGVSWSDVSAGLPAGVGFASFPHVVNAQTYLLGTHSGPNAGVFRTTDAGKTWATVFHGAVASAPVVKQSDGRIIWLLDGGGGVISSTDGGATWRRTDVTGPIGSTLLELPDGRLATPGNTNVLVSDTDGTTWETIGPGLPFAPAGLAYSPVRKAFYIWQSSCEPTKAVNDVQPKSIMRFDVVGA